MDTLETVETPFTDILVPLDGSPAAERALIPALELVRRTGVPLRVLTRALADEKQTLATYLAAVADRHAAVADGETQVVDRESISDAIAEGLGPGTLVCMSSHGRGGVARAVMGSIAEAFLRTLDRPALVVGPNVTDDAILTGRIVACIDGSRESERTIEPARRWAAALDLPLWLMEVGEPGRPGPQPEAVTSGDMMESGHVAGLAGRLGGVKAWDVLHDKDPAHALVAMAATATEPTALLVMATHGRTGWDRLRLGSVTTATVSLYFPSEDSADDDAMTDSIPAASAGPIATLVTLAAADALAWLTLKPHTSVDYKLLWRSGKSVAGLMRIAPGGTVIPHAHVRSHHHMWVIDGSAEMLDERVQPGTYLHIPAGVQHGISAVGEGGCTMLYLYLREDATPGA